MEDIALLRLTLPALFCLLTFLATTGVVWTLLRRRRETEDQAVERICAQLEKTYSLLKSLSETCETLQNREDIQTLKEQIEKFSSAVTVLSHLGQEGRDSVSNSRDGFKLAQKFLQNGDSPVKVAQRLDMGLAEVNLISRLMQK